MKRTTRKPRERGAARAAPLLHFSGPEASIDIVMPALTWTNAIACAEAGDVSLLSNMLRQFDIPLDDPKARRYVADLIDGRIKIRRRGPRARVDRFAADMIIMHMVSWDATHPGAVGTRARAVQIDWLAQLYHCTPGHIRDILKPRSRRG